MNQFTILANESLCNLKQGGIGMCLAHDTLAYYHSDYIGGQGRYKIHGTIENLICTFKNDITRYSNDVLNSAMYDLAKIIAYDLLKISENHKSLLPITVCVIPRAKHEAYYRNDQKLFRQTISKVIQLFEKNNLRFFIDGTHHIIRHTDTATTHLSHNPLANPGTGDMPYKGITRDTCQISTEVHGKNILLIDDLYTKTVGIDEDAIQALYDNGANKVIFYSVGKTVSRY